MNGEVAGMAGGMGAAAMERGFLLELNTKGMWMMHLVPQVMLLFVGE